MNSALPSVRIQVDGRPCVALLDSGCSCCIVYAKYCKSWDPRCVSVVTMNGESQTCVGVGRVAVCVGNESEIIEVDVCVVDLKPLGYDFVLGMNGISSLGGVSISSSGGVSFGGDRKLMRSECSLGNAHGLCASALAVEQKDFRISFEAERKAWIAEWRWLGGVAPPTLKNTITEYSIPVEVRSEYEAEVQKWIDSGWLSLYDDEKLGPPKGLIPLLAVVQQNKGKVRPVLDFRELNTFVDAHTADADVCADKLREWRRQGVNVTMLDLSSAYMQVHIAPSLWPFQTVIFKNRRYALTRLGFGLNLAPLVMKAVISCALAQDDEVRQATSPYVDDILVNEDIMSVERVQEHLERFGLSCKPPEKVPCGARVLGLTVKRHTDAPDGNETHLVWERANELPTIPEKLTRRSIFAMCGKLVSHLPVCGWLRPAAAFIKRRANEKTSSWDDVINDLAFRNLVEDLIQRVKREDPAGGRWDVSGEEAIVWVDASSLATGALVEVEGCVIEDGCWLRPEDGMHINLAELDALLKGINMALVWNMKVIHIKTDSSTVFHWISDALSGKSRLKTKAPSEMLIRRRVSTFTSLVEEYSLRVSISLVPSASNKADALTRVPQSWLGKGADDSPSSNLARVCGAAAIVDLHAVHNMTGHQGIDRTLYFARKAGVEASRDDIKNLIHRCQCCQSIDPAPVKWERGSLDVGSIWERVGMDITHYGRVSYLTLIDCGPSRFTIWRPLKRHSTVAVTQVLQSVFLERGAPEEILTDNDAAFRSAEFRDFARKWGIRLRFRCAYVASGNGIIERCHRMVKRIAARCRCSVGEAVYWYNVSPKDNEEPSTAPANMIHNYQLRVFGIDGVVSQQCSHENCPFSVGDFVWVKPEGVRCDQEYVRGVVTGIVSDLTVEVDGMARHVRDLRPASCPTDDSRVELMQDDDEWDLYVSLPISECDGGPEVENSGLRKSERATVAPDRLGVVPW